MTNKIEFNTNSHMPDLVHIIRSVQRLEGNPDCFGTAYNTCSRRDCAWFEYCQEEVKKAQLINGGKGNNVK